MRSLVIYHTKSGNTGLVAHIIKREMKAHIKEITDYTYQRSVSEYLFTSLLDSASIEPRKISVDYYETIFIGTPVWFGSITPAIKKFISNMDFKGKNIVLFNTMKRVGGDIAIKRMAKLVKKQNGHVIGSFTIKTNCSDIEIVELTKKAVKDLNLNN